MYTLSEQTSDSDHSNTYTIPRKVNLGVTEISLENQKS